MSSITCPHCLAVNRSGANYCLSCGRHLGQANGDAAAIPQPPRHDNPDARQRRPSATSMQPGTDTLTRQMVAATSSQGVTVDVGVAATRHEPLPDGARIGGRYVIRRQLVTAPRQFRYEAEDLSADRPYGPICVIKESGDPAAFSGELIALHSLSPGDGIRPPYDAFTERLGNVRRVFIVGAYGEPLGLSSRPVDMRSALNWGAVLARALAVLHQRQVAFGPFTERSISRDEHGPFLADFAGCTSPGKAEDYARDIDELAATIATMLAGQDQLLSGANVPPRLRDRFASLLQGDLTLGANEVGVLLAEASAAIDQPPTSALHVGHATDIGQTRTLNEDSLLVVDLTVNSRSVNQPLGLFVIADGLGGYDGGEIASDLFVQTIMRQAIAELLPSLTSAVSMNPDLDQWLTEAIQHANLVVHDRAREAQGEMGTTAVAAILIGRKAIIANVGDSRAYHVNAKGATQLTVDHSLVENLVAAGLIARDEAHHHPQAHVIYRTIGDQQSVEVDIHRVELLPDNYLLLCSDGLTNMVSDAVIHQLVTGAVSPQAACRALIAAANAAGGEDNITVIVVKLESPAGDDLSDAAPEEAL